MREYSILRGSPTDKSSITKFQKRTQKSDGKLIESQSSRDGSTVDHERVLNSSDLQYFKITEGVLLKDTQKNIVKVDEITKFKTKNFMNLLGVMKCFHSQ